MEITLKQAHDIIRQGVDLNMSCLLLGSPGIGKSTIFQQVADEINRELLAARKMKTSEVPLFGIKIWEGPSLDPTDARGVILPDRENKTSYFTKSPLIVDPKVSGERGILLIDELSSALKSVQLAFHSTFHPNERRIGEHKLPEGWIPMATGNRIQDGAGANDLLSAFSDRLLVLHASSCGTEGVKIWKRDFANKNNVHELVLAFLSARPDYFNTFEQFLKEKRSQSMLGKLFATPRSHVEVSKLMHYAFNQNFNDQQFRSITFPSVCALVGDTIAAEYQAFKDFWGELPNINLIFQGKNLFPKDKNGKLLIDRLYAVISSLIARVTEQKNLQAGVDRIIEYAQHKDMPTDFCGFAIVDLFLKFKPMGKNNPVFLSKHFDKIASRLID